MAISQLYSLLAHYEGPPGDKLLISNGFTFIGYGLKKHSWEFTLNLEIVFILLSLL